MALSIKTEEAERLERLRGEQEAQGDDVSRMTAFVRERANRYDRRPVTRREWDEAVGDTSEDPGVSR